MRGARRMAIGVGFDFDFESFEIGGVAAVRGSRRIAIGVACFVLYSGDSNDSAVAIIVSGNSTITSLLNVVGFFSAVLLVLLLAFVAAALFAVSDLLADCCALSDCAFCFFLFDLRRFSLLSFALSMRIGFVYFVPSSPGSNEITVQNPSTLDTIKTLPSLDHVMSVKRA